MVRSLARFAAIVPLMWFVAAPQLPGYCVKDPAGNFSKSFVTNGADGKTVDWPGSDSQVKACSIVDQFPL